MKRFIILLCVAGLLGFCVPDQHNYTPHKDRYVDTIPVALPAAFTDDYGIRYAISDTLWLQQPSARYHILRWNLKEQYIIARNGQSNTSDQGLYTRIDYMKFSNMEPFLWGFCLSTYKATTDSLAEFTPTKTDRSNPRKGCNGYPFSRMKIVQ